METDEHRALRKNGLEIDHLTKHAFDIYQPRKYFGDIILIQSMEVPEWLEFFMVDLTGGWDRVVGGNIRKLQTPGNHLSMLHELHVDDLARKVDLCVAAPVLQSM